VRLDVRDSGIGFDPAETSRLFEKFYRIETSGQERLPGTGLGLYLVRRCLELEGGSVHASSDGPGRGACFTVRWPALQRGEG
jgi:signal transduction histidine kinase